MTVPEPHDYTVTQLARLDMKAYGIELRLRLRRDDYWTMLLEPVLVERTRQTLVRIITSIDAQRLNADIAQPNYATWLRSINSLQRWSQERLEAMPAPALSDIPVLSGGREARAWRALSARLAEELEKMAPEALERFQTPYGALNMREWLAARREKGTDHVRS